MTLVRFIPLLLAASLGLGGCLPTKPVTLYSLDNGDPQMPSGKDSGATILVSRVELADYLRGDVIVQRQADGSLALDAGQGRWANSLGEDIDQLLLRQLAAQLDSQRLALPPIAKGFSADLRIELAITRLDSGPEQPAVLEAQWRVLDAKGLQQASRLVRLQAAHDGTVADQVKAQSRLLQQVSQQVALALQPSLASRAKPARPAAKVKQAPAANSQPAPAPTLTPLRTDMEVFRF